jgi:hypothetical protein
MTTEEIKRVIYEWHNMGGGDISIPIETISDIKISKDVKGGKFIEMTYTREEEVGKLNKLDSYKKFREFFKKQFAVAERIYSKEIDDFGRFYDKIINLTTVIAPEKKITEEKIISLSLLLRALRYVAIVLDLTLKGSSRESQIIARNILEIQLVALDVAFNLEGYKVFKECYQQKKNNVSGNGLLDISKLNENKYKLGECIKRLKKNYSTKEYIGTQKFLKRHGLQSEYFSHENLFNIIKDIDWLDNNDSSKTIKLFLGDSVEQRDVKDNINNTLFLIKEIKECVEFIIQGVV